MAISECMYVKNNYTCLLTNRLSATAHRLSCVQLLISLDQPFDYKTNTETVKNVTAVLINKGVLHSYRAEQSNMLIMKVSPGSAYDRYLNAGLKGKDTRCLSEIFSGDELKHILPVDFETLTNNELAVHVERFMNKIPKRHPGTLNPQDVRISIALKHITSNPQEKISLAQIAGLIHLSLPRTRHLFSEVTGTTFKKYVLWARIQSCLSAMQDEQQPQIRVALRYGFTDRSHFIRVFKMSFGITPGMLIRSSRLIC